MKGFGQSASVASGVSCQWRVFTGESLGVLAV
jgi:hypothetical protein